MGPDPQFNDRSVRKIVKLWSLDESCLFDDLGELQKRYGRRNVVKPEAANDDVASNEELVQAEAVPGMAQYQVTLSRDCGPASDAELMFMSSPAVLSSVQGYYSGPAEAWPVTGPTYTTLDGIELDLALMSMSCDLTFLTAQPVAVVDDDQDDLLAEEQDELDVELDSLHGVIVSTGFCLE